MSVSSDGFAVKGNNLGAFVDVVGIDDLGDVEAWNLSVDRCDRGKSF
jgi:hypothetical protein